LTIYNNKALCLIAKSTIGSRLKLTKSTLMPKKITFRKLWKLFRSLAQFSMKVLF